jgi:tellurite resistance protein TerB
MEAIVGGCLLVSAADGEIEKEETSKLDQLIRSNPRLAHFGNEITSTINRYTEQLEAGFRVGRMNILREIDDIKNDPKEAEEVFVNMLTIAEADGQIEPEEQKVLEEVGRRLGLRVEDYSELRVLDSLRPALALLLAFMVVAVDFTSYLLSVIGDAFFVGALSSCLACPQVS